MTTTTITLVKLALYIQLVFACVVVNYYTNLLLNILVKHPTSSNILAAFCVYTAFLALKSMMEAFVSAGCPPADSAFGQNNNITNALPMTKLPFNRRTTTKTMTKKEIASQHLQQWYESV